MPARAAPLTPWARGGLALLCALVVASLVVRVEVSRRQPPPAIRTAGRPPTAPSISAWEGCGPAPPPAPHDARRGVRRADRGRFRPGQSLPAGSVPRRPSRATDRVAYVYRGRVLDSRFITIRLNAIYLARLASARLTGDRMPAIDELAVKVIVPAGCPVSPEAVMAVLRASAPPG